MVPQLSRSGLADVPLTIAGACTEYASGKRLGSPGIVRLKAFVAASLLDGDSSGFWVV
jgi:hypothetical protein